MAFADARSQDDVPVATPKAALASDPVDRAAHA
jgi:hypothetical protein